MTDGPIEAFLNRETETLVAHGVEFYVVQPRAMEWAALVRRRILCDPPSGIATVLPETLRPLVTQALGLLPAMGLLTHARENCGDDGPALALIPVEATDPRWEALRSAVELGIPWRPVAPDTGEGESMEPAEPDTLLAANVAASDLMRLALLEEDRQIPESAARLAAFHLHDLIVPFEVPVLFVCTAEWVRPVMTALETKALDPPLRRIRREDLRLHLASDPLAQLISSEPMGFVKLYEAWRTQSAGAMQDWRLSGETGLPAGRWQMTLALLHEARKQYDAEFSTTLPAALIAPLLKYARNLALTQSRLFPTRYDLVIAARSFYDHNFGWYFFQLLTGAAPAPAGADAPRLDLDPELLGISLRTVHFGLKLRQRIPRFLSAYMERPKEPTPGAWKNAFDEASMCSYPPEDILIEGTALQMKDKGRDALGERALRSHPFSTTLLDGLDVRETVRHWYEKRLYVREEYSGRNKVGSVVIIFDEDDDDGGTTAGMGGLSGGQGQGPSDPSHDGAEHYPYCAHWHGEHTQESDMAFYATDPDDHVVGPGICRCEYGGLLLTSPPGRMWPIWEDPHLRHFRRKSQVLLAAGLQLTQEPVVLYIAPRPPHPFLKRIALRMGLRVLHMPLGSLSPQRIARLRSFHILAHHQARSWAHRFIPDP